MLEPIWNENIHWACKNCKSFDECKEFWFEERYYLCLRLHSRFKGFKEVVL